MINKPVNNLWMRSGRGAIQCDERREARRTIMCESKKRTEIRKLTSLERFICKTENFALNTWVNVVFVERFENESDMTKHKTARAATFRTS